MYCPHTQNRHIQNPTVYTFPYPQLGERVTYLIFNQFNINRELSWLDAEQMCQNVSSVMAKGSTSESREDIERILRTYRTYIHPAMVFLQGHKVSV